MQLSFDREKKDYVITLRKDGFEDLDVELMRGVNGWVWGNIIFGGVVGLLIDVATGALYQLKPSKVKVNLVPEKALEDGSTAAIPVP